VTGIAAGSIWCTGPAAGAAGSDSRSLTGAGISVRGECARRPAGSARTVGARRSRGSRWDASTPAPNWTAGRRRPSARRGRAARSVLARGLPPGLAVGRARVRRLGARSPRADLRPRPARARCRRGHGRPERERGPGRPVTSNIVQLSGGDHVDAGRPHRNNRAAQHSRGPPLPGLRQAAATWRLPATRTFTHLTTGKVHVRRAGGAMGGLQAALPSRVGAGRNRCRPPPGRTPSK
jgi:hypothetical protein